MSFDIRTLLAAVALANAFCAGARLLLWRMNPGIPGLGRWALAGAASVLTLLLIFAYGKFHWQPALALAQLAAVIGLSLAWDGFRRFVGKSPLSLQTWSFLAVVVFTWIAVAHFRHSTAIQALGNAVLIVVLSSLIARELLTTPKPDLRAMRVTGWIYALNAAVFLLRTVAAKQNTIITDSLNPSGFADVMLLWLLCFTIAVTLGMVLMTAERLQNELNRQANSDPLTGALNRRSFSLLTKKAMAQARRHDHPLSVLIMDLDEFKQINDSLGHDVGDRMLCRFVTIAEEILRSEDIFCRFGGEEFVALLPNTGAKCAQVAAERLRTEFAISSERLHNIDKIEAFDITVSIGIAELQPGEDFESLLGRADNALYNAKDMGRNRCELAVGGKVNSEEQCPNRA